MCALSVHVCVCMCALYGLCACVYVSMCMLACVCMCVHVLCVMCVTCVDLFQILPVHSNKNRTMSLRSQTSVRLSQFVQITAGDEAEDSDMCRDT